jgi:hypothetical protein
VEVWIESKKITEGLYGNNCPRHSAIFGNGFLKNREFLDQVLFWNASDLERKLAEFRQYYNSHRIHTALDGDTPSEIAAETVNHRADLGNFNWKSHCRGLYQLPVAS